MHYFARIAVTYIFAVIALFCVANKASAMPLFGYDEKGNEIRVHNVDKYLAEKPKPKPKPKVKPKPRAAIIATKPKKKPPAPKKVKPRTKFDVEDFASEVAGTTVAGAIGGAGMGPSAVVGGAFGAIGGAGNYVTRWAVKNRKFVGHHIKGAMEAMDPMGEFIH